MKTYVPTSDVLRELLNGAPAEHVTLRRLLVSLEECSFGIVMLIMRSRPPTVWATVRGIDWLDRL